MIQQTFEMKKEYYDAYLSRKRTRDDIESIMPVLALGRHGTMLDLHEGRCDIGIRHDMDTDCENAVRMAVWEHHHGIRSTYYVLHTDWYYRYRGRLTPLVIAALEAIASLGHEIGIHNNAVAAMLGGGGEAVDILAKDLAELRSHGFDIRGVASHGDRANHKANLPNDQAFTEFVLPENIERLKSVPLASLGLAYEAYHVEYDEYLSDCGGEWNIPLPTTLDSSLVILMHPLYWMLP